MKRLIMMLAAVAAMAMANIALADVGPKGAVQLWADGPYWATTNIGAEEPEDYGYYFWWGDTTGYRPSADGRFGFSFRWDNSAIYTCDKTLSELQSAGWVTSSGVLAPSHDAAHVKWGDNWRMPTRQELIDLYENKKCKWTWTTRNGVCGYIVRGGGAYASQSIFLPAAGYGDGTFLYDAGSHGEYWSSVPRSDSGMNVYEFHISSDYHIMEYYSPSYGFTIRPVRMTPWTPSTPSTPPSPLKPASVTPTLFGPVTAELPFTGDATYNGWVRNADGTLAGLLTVKAAKAAKPEKGGQSKLTVTYVPFGGRKQTIKLPNDAMPVAGEVATVAIPGIGTVRFTGNAIVGEGVDVQAGKDTLKSKDRDEKAAATAAAASKAGVWTFALGADAGYAGFTVTVDKKGKGKLAGTLPDGTKVSVSSQGVLGDGALAVPFAYAKKGSVGFVFWVRDDGSAAVSDLTKVKLLGGAEYAATVVAPDAAHRLSNGAHAFTAGGVSQAFTVAGKKWSVPKQNKRAEVDPNPTGLKLAFTEKTGAVKGSFTVADGKAKAKYTVVGVVVGGKFYGSAYGRNLATLSATTD